MNKRFLVALILTWLLGLAPEKALAAAGAQSDPFDGRLLPVELVMAFRRQIDLSAGQNAAIGKLVVDLQQQVAGKQWQMQSTYFELLEVLDEPTIDEARAVALTKQAVDAENDIKLAQVRLLVRVRNLLRPEQIEFLRGRLAGGWSKE